MRSWWWKWNGKQKANFAINEINKRKYLHPFICITNCSTHTLKAYTQQNLLSFSLLYFKLKNGIVEQKKWRFVHFYTGIIGHLRDWTSLAHNLCHNHNNDKRATNISANIFSIFTKIIYNNLERRSKLCVNYT